MGLAAQFIDDWEWVSLDPELRFEKEVDANDNILFYKRLHSRFSRRRRFRVLTSFTEDVGESSSTMTGYVSAVAFLSYTSTTRTWILTVDRTTVTDQITGEGVQDQVWETLTERELVDVPAVFGGAIP
jgi:predicted GNAT family acetyltransferase